MAMVICILCSLCPLIPKPGKGSQLPNSGLKERKVHRFVSVAMCVVVGIGGDDCLSDLRMHGLRRDGLRTLSANVPISHRKNIIFFRKGKHFFRK